MIVRLALFHTKPKRFAGCTPPTAAERMARYSLRAAMDMQARENEGAGYARVRVVDGRQVLVALPGRVNKLPNQKDPT
jgi:hypothetical protein